VEGVQGQLRRSHQAKHNHLAEEERRHQYRIMEQIKAAWR
jgi:hypothetical protein